MAAVTVTGKLLLQLKTFMATLNLDKFRARGGASRKDVAIGRIIISSPLLNYTYLRTDERTQSLTTRPSWPVWTSASFSFLCIEKKSKCWVATARLFCLRPSFKCFLSNFLKELVPFLFEMYLMVVHIHSFVHGLIYYKWIIISLH